jgi:hypothetical protein
MRRNSDHVGFIKGRKSKKWNRTHVTAPYHVAKMWQQLHIKTLLVGSASSGETSKQQQQVIPNRFSSTLARIHRHGDKIFKPLILMAFIVMGVILTAAAGHELVDDLKNNVEDCSLCAASMITNNSYNFNSINNNINNNNNDRPTPIPPPTHLFELGNRAIYTKDGAVNVFHFDRAKAVWVPMGQPIQETLKDYAGWSLSLSRDGNSLSMASLEEETGYYGSKKNKSKRSTRVFEYHVESNSWVRRAGVVDDENSSTNVVLEEAQFIMAIPEHGKESQGISVTRF